MKKYVLPILIGLALLLAACNTAASDEAEIPTATVDEGVAEPEPTPAGTSAETAQEFTPPNAENPCMPFSLLDQSLVSPYPNLPPVTADDWSLGPEDAAATFIEYSEPQCPYCAQLEPILMDLYEAYPNDVRIVYRHFPLDSIHDKSLLASQALEAAGKQGYFQEMKNFLFERQTKDPDNPNVPDLPDSEFWSSVSPDEFDEWLAERVPELGIDADQFLVDMFSPEVETKIQQAPLDAANLGLRGTPTLFINGYTWPENQRGLEIFSIYVNLILNQDREYDTCPAMVIDETKSYTATIETTKGQIVAELYPEVAPYAVNSFVYLARAGWYENAPFIVADQFVLSGDLSDTGYGGAGYVYLDEANDELALTEPGMLATFSLGSGLNSSAFFINKTALEGQEGRTIFGRVIEGMDAVNALQARENIFDEAVDHISSVIISEQ